MQSVVGVQRAKKNELGQLEAFMKLEAKTRNTDDVYNKDLVRLHAVPHPVQPSDNSMSTGSHSCVQYSSVGWSSKFVNETPDSTPSYFL